MPSVSDDQIVRSIRLYRDTLQETRALFLESGEIAQGTYGWLAGSDDPTAAPENAASSASMADQMNDLHEGFVMKVFADVLGDPSASSLQQRQLGRVLLEHIWGESVMGSKLHEAVQWLITTASGFTWYDVTRPFLELPSLRDRWGTVETLASRMAMLIVAVDGDDGQADRARVSSCLKGLADAQNNSRPISSVSVTEPISNIGSGASTSSSPTIDHAADQENARDAIRWLREEAERLRTGAGHDAANRPTPTRSGGPPTLPPTKPTAGLETKPNQPPIPDAQTTDNRTPEERLAETREKLDKLIGLGAIKNQIETLANFLKMEKRREEMGLPTTRPSLHMSFVGNPGTGKTTVARIIAEIYGALGILSKGHLVETDRSGLVAEYAGQTGPKTNSKIDEALDGVLFIDEAYTLVDEDGQDQYGREAVQTLLKRMEDQRERLVVILAGYPREMTRMIRSNPGLSSRVGTTMQFDDYDPESLCRIFELIAAKAKYELPTATRRSLLRGFSHLFFNRDRHFGNGRTSRNAFERSVRRLANRISALPEVTRELLVTLQPEDIEIPDIEDAMLVSLTEPPGLIRVQCSQCEKAQVIDDQTLGTQIECSSCKESFLVQWGNPVVDLQAETKPATETS